MQVVDNATVRRIDEESIAAGTPSLELMERAGAGAATVFRERCAGRSGTTLVVCGRGNNGGDGLVMARHLHLDGEPVAVFWLGGDASPDCGHNLDRADAAGVEIHPAGSDPVASLRSCLDRNPGRWVVDALLGSGFRPPLREPMDGLAGVLRDCGRRGFALDAPTGADTDHGEVDPHTMVADWTVVFGPPRRGMFMGKARRHCGRIALVDPGFDPEVVASVCAGFTPRIEWIDGDRAAALWPRRRVDAHKYRAGSLLVVAGSAGMSGAAALAAGAAHRSGAGLVEVLTPAPVASVIDVLTPESLVRGLAATESGGFASGLADGILRSATGRAACVLGCGVGPDPDTAALMVELCAILPHPTVVDADALNAFSRTGQRPQFGPDCVLTPHAGELARLVEADGAEIAADRIAAACDAARELGQVVALKGGPTVVAGPDGRCALVGSGGPELATAGTGDVLAGTIGALLAAGLPAFEAAACGAWVHGRAGEHAREDRGTAGVVASDLFDGIARVGRELEAWA